MIEIGIFAAKTLLIVLALGSLLLLIAMLASRASQKPELEVEPLHKKFEDIQFFLKSFTFNKEEMKSEKKKRKALEKQQDKNPSDKRIFVLSFDGDVQASQVESLRQEVTAVLSVATAQDEVVVRVESPGGVVHTYGLAASQLLRIREKGIPLTVCVDQVAASGGYLMACVANQVVAAPFAILGSIGVVAQLPNFNKVLRKYDVDWKEYTAGEFKRTVTHFGEITPKGEAKFLEQLESTHVLFKRFVSQYRPQIDIAKVATGEYWYGTEALQMALVDKIQTSDDYLLNHSQKGLPVFEISYEQKRSFSEKLSEMISLSAEKAFTKVLERFERPPLV